MMKELNVFLLFTAILLFSAPYSFSQKVQIQIVSPKELKGRKAILLTREKGFAAIVHSVKLNADILNLDIDNDLVPDLYQLHVSQIKGSLLFFLEKGARILLDTSDIEKSTVTNSKSTSDWQVFRDSIQKPYDQLIKEYATGEKRARMERNADSLNFWVDKQAWQKEDLVEKTGTFILNNPASYVSLYLLKINWYAFQHKAVFEKLDTSLAGHRTYLFLKEKNDRLLKKSY